MPNLISISFSDCDGPEVLWTLIPSNPLSSLILWLKCVKVLRPGIGLKEVAQARKDGGILLETIMIGDRFDLAEDYTELEELGVKLQVGWPTEILWWELRDSLMPTGATMLITATPCVAMSLPLMEVLYVKSLNTMVRVPSARSTLSHHRGHFFQCLKSAAVSC